MVLVVVMLASCQGETHMSIETDGTGIKNVKWTAPAGVVGLNAKSISMWIYPDDFGSAYDLFLISDGTGTDADEYFDIPTQITTGKFGLIAHFSTTNGIWLTTSATLTPGAWNHVVITYDGSATTNDPIFYLNGASVAITELATPVGTYRTGTTTDLYIGSLTSGANIDGKIASLLVYNRILSPAEIADAYASRLAIPDWNGLVFAPSLIGGAGLQVFDGSTLAAGNTIVDQVNGYVGVPSGSPLAVADTYLEYK